MSHTHTHTHTQPETSEQTEERLSRQSTEVMLKEILFPDIADSYTQFKYQTHAELQQSGPAVGVGQEKKPSYHAARDTLDPARYVEIRVRATEKEE